jgi:hypothetical protein
MTIFDCTTTYLLKINRAQVTLGDQNELSSGPKEKLSFLKKSTLNICLEITPEFLGLGLIPNQCIKQVSA